MLLSFYLLSGSFQLFFGFKYTQVWTILDMHHINICSSLNWHICHVCDTQAEEGAMELWHQPGDLVRWSVLWLCHHRSPLFVCDPQILLCTSGTCPTLLSLWILPICLHSGPCELLLLQFSPFFENVQAVPFSSIAPELLFCAVYVSCAIGHIQMGDCRGGWVHVSNICGTQPSCPYHVCRWKVVLYCSWHLCIAACSCCCPKVLPLHSISLRGTIITNWCGLK